MNSAENTRPKEQVNVKYKDRLFKKIFGTEEGKENALSLYNAVNGTDYQDASQLGFTNATQFAQDKDIQIYSDQPIEEPKMRPYEKRKAATEKNSNKTNKAPKKQEVQKSTRVVKEKPKKQPAAKPQKDARVLAYEESIRQAEKEGAIAGLFVLLFMGIIVGGYYLLSLAYPAISVDSLTNKLIETVMMWFVDMTQRPPDLETIPIFGDFLQWLGDKWHSMVF